MSKLLVEYNDKKFWVSQKQAETIALLAETHKGGMGAIHGYVPTSDYVKSPVVDIQLITRFSTPALYQRKIDALSGISFKDVEDDVKADKVLKVLPRNEQIKLFNERMSQEIDSLTKTLDGERNDSYRAGHDRCYAVIGDGIKVHFETKKGLDNLKHPVIENGYPVAESIMVAYLELGRTYRESGEKKVVNSGDSVRMKNCIEKQLNSRSVGYRTLSLKENNFEKFTVSRKTITPNDISGFDTLTEAFKQWIADTIKD